MAFASAFSDDPTIRASTTRARFAEYAKRQLDEEFGRPVMSLVPALALLAEYHCGIGERDAGYMYMGMSFRAAHIFVSTNNPEPETNDGIVTIPESIKRDWHFWSAFSCDKLMAIEYARDYDMPVPHSGVSLPSIDADLDNQAWPLEPPLNSNINTTPARLTTLVFHETCKLMIVATRIIDIIHSQSKRTLEEHMVLNTHLRLDTWFNSLPENLLVWARSTSPLPHVIVLHICYWWLLIVLHQPLYRFSKEKERDQNAMESGPEQRLPIADLSTKMCDRAAHKIVQLLTMFDNQHGLRFFPCNMIEAVRACAIALLRELTLAPPAAVKKKSNAASGVNACINALRIMSNTWPRARSISEDLEQRLREQHTPSFPMTQLDGPAGDLPTESAVEQEPEDAADISQVFYQYMHDWGHMPVPPGPVYLSSGPGSESPYSQSGELGWEGI
ncbi:Fungal specific transcription factor domain [Ceratobasidium sp. AG-Ba]|nr:Fungal specific transcription factor domain [Ceratobasidium sp. AG-Ba]